MGWVKNVKDGQAAERQKYGISLEDGNPEDSAHYALGKLAGLTLFTQFAEHMKPDLTDAAINKELAGYFDEASMKVTSETILPSVIRELERQSDILTCSIITEDGKRKVSESDLSRLTELLLRDDLQTTFQYAGNKAFDMGCFHTLEWPLRGLNFQLQAAVMASEITGDNSAETVARIRAYKVIIDKMALLMNPQNPPQKILSGDIESMKPSGAVEKFLGSMMMAQAKIDQMLFPQPGP